MQSTTEFGGERLAPRAGRAAERLNQQSNSPFYLQMHPMKHGIVGRGDRAHLLPIMGPLHLTGGFQGIRDNGSIDLCLEMQRRRGWITLIPVTDSPRSKVPEYRMRYPAKKGGYYHATHWSHPRQVGGQPLPANIDHDGYVAFIESLIVSGVLPAIEIGVHELIVSKMRRSLQRMNQQAKRRSIGDRIERAERDLGIALLGFDYQQDLARLGMSAGRGDRMALLTAELDALRAAALRDGSHLAAEHSAPVAAPAAPVAPAGLTEVRAEPQPPRAAPAVPVRPLTPPDDIAAPAAVDIARSTDPDDADVAGLTRGRRAARVAELGMLTWDDLRVVGKALGVTGRSVAVVRDRILAAEFPDG